MSDKDALIKNIPDAVCWQVAAQLDRHEKPNWKSLVHNINQTRKIYSERDILRFHMAIIKPRGSPTLELLTDLGKKRKTVDQLVSWMKQLGKFPELVTYLERGDDAVREIKPSITSQPKSSICELGSSFRLNVEARGCAPLKFQWFKGSYELPGKTSNVLTVDSVSEQDTGFYTCRVNNDFGYVYSTWSKVDVIASPSILPLNDALNIPLITMHPRSTTVVLDGVLRLYGDAVGNPQPTLQWFHNNSPLLGQCSRELIVLGVSEQHEGFYKLRASNKHQYTDSFAAQVTVVKQSINNKNTNNSMEFHSLQNQTVASTANSKPLMTSDLKTMSAPVLSTVKQEVAYRGSNDCNSPGISIQSPDILSEKVALVIGNQNYSYGSRLGELVHPINDAHDISAKLRSLDFKVVSLIDLNLKDMKGAVKFFSDLLDTATYALFYFAGHGFEISGESFLMPLDASPAYVPEENLALSDVLFPMTRKRPKLSVVLVDSCRTEPAMCRTNPIPTKWEQCTGPDLQRKNVTIGYGCCAKGRVLESPLMRNGYFAHYLLQHIGRNIKIDDVLFEVSKGIHQEHIIDPASGRTQVVYRHSTLVDDFKLTDKAVSSESTDQALLWQQAHVAPESPVPILQNDFVTVNLVFTPNFSNSLVIQSEIIKKENCDSCNVMFILPQSIGGATVETVSSTNKEKSMPSENKRVRISNLERLEGDINIHMEVIYVTNGVRQQQRAFYSIKEKPLYAKITEKIRELKMS